MNEAVVQFVSRDQNGFVPDGFIAENLMRLQLLQAAADEDDLEALFLFCDMEKAFDRCSWEFLLEGLKELGFGDDFINFVKLMYSDGANAVPTRQMYVNGHLGPHFPLGSGVAQGCSLSVGLFLVIVEPLTRMINNSRDIKGIKIKAHGKRPTKHKISHYADDSILKLLLGDVTAALDIMDMWQDATSMKENDTKRELLLLGSLRGHPERLPSRLTAGGTVKPAADGDTIRSLGVPIGNDFDVLQWWLSRYHEVKRRVAHWHGIGRLSIVGRNMLLQSILYGSLRYWFFTLTVPDEIIDIVESDAREILWAAKPELRTDEEGTKKGARRYIKKDASYLPQKSGGGASCTSAITSPHSKLNGSSSTLTRATRRGKTCSTDGYSKTTGSGEAPSSVARGTTTAPDCPTAAST